MIKNQEMSDIPRSNSVIRDGNVVVERFFNMLANQATTTQDAMVADQTYQSTSNGLDSNSFGTPSVREEEIFVTCASFGGDAEDEADDEVEENASDVGSIDIMDGRATMSVVPRDDTRHADLEPLKDQDGFCPGDMDALCVSKNNTIDGTSQVTMGSDSSDIFGEDEKKRDVKKSRFRWYLHKFKKRGAADSIPPSLESDGSADGSSSFNKCGAEMVFCSSYHPSKDDAAQKRFKKRSSSWYPRIVRLPRMNKRMTMKQSQGKAERAGIISEEFKQMTVEPLAKVTKTKEAGFFDGEESVAQEQLSVTTDDDVDEAIKNANLIDYEPIEQHDTRSQGSNGAARNKAFPTNMNGDMVSLASSHHSPKLSAKTYEDDIKCTSSIHCNKSSKMVVVGDCDLVFSQKSRVDKDMLSVCSQHSREFLFKETSNDDKSVASRLSRRSTDTNVVSLYSQRSRKSISKEAASDSKSSATESKQSSDQDVASVYSHRSQAASLREVADVGNDDKSVASRLSRGSTDTNVVSLYSQRSRKSISKEAASDSKSSATKSKQSSDQDVASMYSHRSQVGSLKEVANESQSLATQNSDKVPDHCISSEARSITSQRSLFKEKSQKRCDDEVENLTIASFSSKNITSNGIHNESDTNKPNLPPHVKEMVSVSDSFNVDGEDHVKNREDPAPRSRERAEGKEEMKVQPLRRFLSELTPSKNRRVVNFAGDEEENVAPDGGPTSLRRISSDIPKTLLSRKQQSRKKGSKPFEISGSHLSQPCPSDITECTEDGEFNSFLRVVGTRDEAMEPIDESKDPSDKDSSYVHLTENEEEDQTQSEEHIELDTKSITSVGASETISEEELEREKENEHVADSANAKTEDDENSEAKEGNKEMDESALMDGDPETTPKNNQKAGLTLGVGAFQYVTRRISRDVLLGQKDNSNQEHKNLSPVGRSSQTTKSMKNSKPINVTAKKLGSAGASKNVSIAEVAEQSSKPLTKGDDKVGTTWPQKENVAKSESLSKLCQSNSRIPTKCLLGSFGNRIGMKGRNGEEKRHSNGAENSQVKEGTHMYECELSDQEVFEREEAQSESSSMVVCTEDDDQDHDAASVTKNDDSDIKDTTKPKNKLKSTFHFWKFQSKAAATRKTLKKNNMSNYKSGLASPNPAETKYDNEEDNLRGGGSQREGPASDKDSVSHREATDASSVESHESTMLKEEGNPNLFKKLKSMQFTDQSEVEKLLDERLDTVEAEPDKSANAVERKTKLPTGILKKNSRFSAGWRKDQKDTEKNHFEQGDDESNASTVLFTLSAEGKTGFEVMPVLGLIEI